MKRYRCKKELVLDYYDDDGCCDSAKQLVVRVGEIYEYDENCQDLLIANEPAVHLYLVHDTLCAWVEIYPTHCPNILRKFQKRADGVLHSRKGAMGMMKSRRYSRSRNSRVLRNVFWAFWWLVKLAR